MSDSNYIFITIVTLIIFLSIRKEKIAFSVAKKIGNLFLAIYTSSLMLGKVDLSWGNFVFSKELYIAIFLVVNALLYFRNQRKSLPDFVLFLPFITYLLTSDAQIYRFGYMLSFVILTCGFNFLYFSKKRLNLTNDMKYSNQVYSFFSFLIESLLIILLIYTQSAPIQGEESLNSVIMVLTIIAIVIHSGVFPFTNKMNFVLNSYNEPDFLEFVFLNYFVKPLFFIGLVSHFKIGATEVEVASSLSVFFVFNLAWLTLRTFGIEKLSTYIVNLFNLKFGLILLVFQLDFESLKYLTPYIFFSLASLFIALNLLSNQSKGIFAKVLTGYLILSLLCFPFSFGFGIFRIFAINLLERSHVLLLFSYLFAIVFQWINIRRLWKDELFAPVSTNRIDIVQNISFALLFFVIIGVGLTI